MVVWLPGMVFVLPRHGIFITGIEINFSRHENRFSRHENPFSRHEKIIGGDCERVYSVLTAPCSRSNDAEASPQITRDVVCGESFGNPNRDALSVKNTVGSTGALLP